MATYTSTPVNLPLSAEAAFNKLSNLGGLKNILNDIPEDQIPTEQLEMVQKIEINGDTITIPGGPTGDISLIKGNCVSPSLVSYDGVGTPVPLSLQTHIESAGADACSVTVVAEIQVPAMLKPMLNGPMQQMVNQVAQSLTQLTKF